jgi:hypothetical protein
MRNVLNAESVKCSCRNILYARNCMYSFVHIGKRSQEWELHEQ